MNGFERAYAEFLAKRQAAGEVIEFLFDCFKLRLAGNTFYTPDFFVVLANGEIEFHEVKGHWEDDARVKIKVAADKYPFRFFGITRHRKTGWQMEEIG